MYISGHARILNQQIRQNPQPIASLIRSHAFWQLCWKMCALWNYLKNNKINKPHTHGIFMSKGSLRIQVLEGYVYRGVPGLLGGERVMTVCVWIYLKRNEQVALLSCNLCILLVLTIKTSIYSSIVWPWEMILPPPTPPKRKERNWLLFVWFWVEIILLYIFKQK